MLLNLQSTGYLGSLQFGKMQRASTFKSHYFWTNKVQSLKGDSHELWTTVNHLMGKKQTSPKQDHSADEVLNVFTKKGSRHPPRH